MDFSTLRAQAMSSEAEEEAVTVNTRALIDKVLARYSSGWAVLRELIANAADACATKVTIRFETTTLADPTGGSASSLQHTLNHSTICRLVVSNNGNIFLPSDWARLKSIAEGNPDEQKIGAFGVGFYSVFADCENPFVVSGSQALAFYWKRNALFTRKLQLGEHTPNTSFVLDYRNTTSKIPDLAGLYQFLATSLTFANLRTIELWLDGWNLLVLTKNIEQSASVAIPKEINNRTKEGMMKITGIQEEVVRMSAVVSSVADCSLSSAPDVLQNEHRKVSMAGSISRQLLSKITKSKKPGARPIVDKQPAEGRIHLTTSTAAVCLHMLNVNISTSVTAEFTTEIERATKKPPPKNTKLAFLWSPLAPMNGEGDHLGIFDSVVPSKSGRIFIGFPTHQTTGLLAHMSLSSAIPTVERESMDLNARWVGDWNREILRVAGTVARIAWNGEMRVLKEKMARRENSGRGKAPDVLAEAVHAFEQFAFRESTPQSRVGKIIQRTFWKAGNGPIDVFSSHGVLPSNQVRLAADGVSGFISGIPVLPEEIVKAAESFVTALEANGLISKISVGDIKKELEKRALNDNQLLELLKWAQKKVLTSEDDVKSVFASARALITETRNGVEITRNIILRLAKHHVHADAIPCDFPVGLDTMPIRYTKEFSRAELQHLGWHELPLKEWVRFLVSTLTFPTQYRKGFPQNDITRSPEFAGKVLGFISGRWSYITTEDQQVIAELLRCKTIMPTKLGMMAPRMSYLASVTLFSDLANVTGVEGVSETVLVALGVRKMVDLSVVLERLKPKQTSTQGAALGTLSFADLINYLLTVSDQLGDSELKLLRDASICYAEGNKVKLYKICDLYEPADTLRTLKVRVLDWPMTYRPGSKEDALLRHLELKQFPTVLDLVHIIAQAIAARDKLLRDRALQYFVANYTINRYNMFDQSDIKMSYLPLEGEEGRYSTPAHCFTNEGAALLGYSILRRDLQPHAHKFGVATDPSISSCISRLLDSPPRSLHEATAVFSYLGCRKQSELFNLWEEIGDSKFVPIFSRPDTDRAAVTRIALNRQTKPRHVAPGECYVGDSKAFAMFFDFVNFGEDGNRFLRRCGSRYDPSCLDVGYRFVQEPALLLDMLSGMTQNYKYWLQFLATHSKDLQGDLRLWKLMKASAFLLCGMHEGDQGARDRSSYNSTTRSKEIYGLKSAREIVVVDDPAVYRMFRNKLCTAPRNDTLEQFYIDLGSERLSKLVDVTYGLGSETSNPLAAKKMENLVVERARFFLNEIDDPAIKVDWAQLQAGLKVKTTSSISMRRSLRCYDISHSESTTATVVNGGSPMEWTLWFTPKKYHISHVSAAIAQILLHRPNLGTRMLFDSLLTKDIGDLEAYGFDVSRILVAQEEEHRITEDQRQRERELTAKLKAEGHLPPINGGGVNRYPLGSGGSFANESSITRNFDAAIKASCAYKATKLQSATSSQKVEDQPNATYCDIRPGKDLVLAAPPCATSNTLPIFLPPSFMNYKTTWLREHTDSANRFAATLAICADALGVSRECLHVFFEEKGNTMAFNREGSLFFNLRAWEDLGHGSDEGKGGEEGKRYWLVVVCHEVAHNLVKGHGAEHGYWT
ncbi:hypothetical protein FGG08_004874 [Glutinoglossum americanum]|uniref:Sacsin/Nov domain-containing protein n=1 Tax=Glutinoglossum americanum TaxID=1670608 RepID=A0A9P8HZL0_9PEZI|nr:hypothetical protein FGG08_004874 [Glutinoglossum americanum]